MAVTNAVSWRSEGIRYKKNEVFLDVVESVNLLVNSNGSVVRSEVMGALKMRTFLSGMPECKLGLNDKVKPSSNFQTQSHHVRRCKPDGLLWKELSNVLAMQMYMLLCVQCNLVVREGHHASIVAARALSSFSLLLLGLRCPETGQAVQSPAWNTFKATSSCRLSVESSICLAQVLFDNQGRSTKNKSVDLEDIKFHQCVRLTRFENDRTISFIPPDGNFDLM